MNPENTLGLNQQHMPFCHSPFKPKTELKILVRVPGVEPGKHIELEPTGIYPFCYARMVPVVGVEPTNYTGS